MLAGELEIGFGGVQLHVWHDSDSWCIESPDIPSLFAGGDSYEEASKIACEAVRNLRGPGTHILLTPIEDLGPWPPDRCPA